MLKKELLELLKEVEEDKEIDSLLPTTKLTLDKFKEAIENDESIKGYMEAYNDSTRSKAVETYKNNKGKKAIEEAVKKALADSKTDGLTPEQIKFKELEAKLEAMQKKEKLNNTKASYGKIFDEKKLDKGLMDFINFNAEENEINISIDNLSNIINNIVKSNVDGSLKDVVKPEKGGQVGEDSLIEAYKLKYPGVKFD